MGGATDLTALLAERVISPTALVDLRALPGATDVALDGDGALRLGAGASLDAVATHPLVRERVPLLAAACAGAGTPELRQAATLGGNLCQRPHCRYFRGGVPCHKNGGDGCPARDGENRYLAIMGGDPCWIVHPSEAAVALTALEASVELSSAAGTRVVPIADFYLLPRERLDHETVLRPGEWVSAVTIPAGSHGGVQRWYRETEPGAWDWTLVTLAAHRRLDREVRFVLGAVAPKPWRVYGSIEEDASVGNLADDDVETLAERALYDAEPLSQNEYKVPMATALLRRAIRDLWAPDESPDGSPDARS